VAGRRSTHGAVLSSGQAQLTCSGPATHVGGRPRRRRRDIDGRPASWSERPTGRCVSDNAGTRRTWTRPEPGRRQAEAHHVHSGPQAVSRPERIDGWDGWTLRLIADNDLTYHHAVEVSFRAVEFVCSPRTFSRPVFREPTSDEIERAVRVLDAELGEAQVFAWEIDSDPPETCMIVAEAVEIVEGPVQHEQPGS
jgi:hypothetical protein